MRMITQSFTRIILEGRVFALFSEVRNAACRECTVTNDDVIIFDIDGSNEVARLLMIT